MLKDLALSRTMSRWILASIRSSRPARYLNVSRPQVYSLVRSVEVPAIKLGGRGVWRVDRRQLDDYIERLLEQTREWALSHPLSQERRAKSD